MQRNTAEILSLQVLAWIAAQDDIFLDFLQATGANTTSLRDRASDAEFQGAILDFLMTNDAWIQAFCDAHGLAYTDPAAARAALPGGADLHWT